MNNHNNKLSFSTASFYTSFLPNKDNISFGNHRQFLQSPLWQPISNIHKPIDNKSDKKKHQLSAAAKNTLHQAIYILPKSPSHVSIYLQLPKFRSLSVLMRCGHVSQLVENWLCNPMEQLKRNTEKNQQYTMNHEQHHRRRSSSSPLCIMSSSSSTTTTNEAGPLSVVNHKNALIPSYRKYDDISLSSVFVHFQISHEKQEQMKIRYANVPCLFTVVCVTYNCGTVSLSVNQIDSLDFLLSPNTMNPFLVQCDLVPQHPVTVHQLVPSSSSVYHQQLQICDFESNLPQHEEESKVAQMDSHELYDCTISKTEPWIKELHAAAPIIEKEDLSDQKAMEQAPVVELLHYKETLLYQQEDDDEESGMFTSDEDFSLIDEDDMTEYDDNYHYFKAKAALLELVQDTLRYIQSNGGALTDELNNLKPKLYDYCSM